MQPFISISKKKKQHRHDGQDTLSDNRKWGETERMTCSKRPLEPLGCCREDKASVHETGTLLTERLWHPAAFYCTWNEKQYLFIMRLLQFIVKLMSLWKYYKIVYNLNWLSVVDYILILTQPLSYFSMALNHNASYTLCSSGPWGNVSFFWMLLPWTVLSEAAINTLEPVCSSPALLIPRKAARHLGCQTSHKVEA